MYGLSEKTISALNEVFSKYSEINEVILYGSRAKGNFKNGSDIDLSVKGKDINLSLLSKISSEIDDLLLPYMIDLSIYHEIKNNDLLEHINRVGVSFYFKS